MEYEKVPDFDKYLITQLDNNEPEKMIMALISVVQYCGNYCLAVNTTRRFINHPNEYVRGTAIECISHIARLWGKLPEDLIASANKSLTDKSEWVQGKGDDAIYDLEVFIKNYKRPTNT